MRDQASTLRNLIQHHTDSGPIPSAAECRRACVIAFTSGKGGVGKSNLALNVAVALAQQKARVCVLDANQGLSSLELLCGLNCYWNLSHVLTGAKSLQNVILKGPAGINVVPGAGGLIEFADVADRAPHELATQFGTFEAAFDFLILDTSAGPQRAARQFAAAADFVFLVATPEPTAIADAYATLKAWYPDLPTCPEVLVNRAESPSQARQILTRFAQTAELFLRCEVPAGSFVAEDPNVSRAIFQRQPFLCTFPDSPASQDVQQIAKRLLAGSIPTHNEPFLSRLITRPVPLS